MGAAGECDGIEAGNPSALPESLRASVRIELIDAGSADVASTLNAKPTFFGFDARNRASLAGWWDGTSALLLLDHGGQFSGRDLLVSAAREFRNRLPIHFIKIQTDRDPTF